MRDVGRAGPLEDAARAAGVAVDVRALDVTRPETVAPVVEELEADGGVDVLVNNAGFAFGGFFEATANRDFEEQLATNLLGALTCTRAVLPGMRARRCGTILNVSSVSGGSGAPVLSAYTASKFALEGWSESLAYEVRPFGIRVVVLQPGTFKTPIFSDRNRRLTTGAPPDSPFVTAYRRAEADMLAKLDRYGQRPERVAVRIADVVDADRPPFRVVVGADARIELTLKRILPSGAFQWIADRVLWHEYPEMLAEELARPGDEVSRSPAPDGP
jgi:NAD(P)-dependent dehydrogenase (short-subunit alcohol dehydrogenase family)